MHLSDELAMWDDAANVTVIVVPVSWPGFWRVRHLFFLKRNRGGVRRMSFEERNDFKDSWCREGLKSTEAPLGGNRSTKDLTLSSRKVLTESVNKRC